MVKEKLTGIVSILLILLLLSSISIAQENLLSVIPIPKEYRILDGSFELSAGTAVKKFMDHN